MQRNRLSYAWPIACATSLAASFAVAQDGGFRLTFGIEQRLEAGRNLELAVPETGNTVTSVTRLSFGVISETAIDRLEFFATSALLVENAFDTDGTETEFGRPELRFAYTREVPNAIFEATARFESDDIDAFDEDLDDLGSVGTRTDYGVSARLETGRTAPFGFAVGASFDTTEYDNTNDPDLIDSTTTRGDVAAIFHFSEVLTGRVGVEYVREEDDDLAGSVSETATAFVGLDYEINERLDLNLRLGYAETDREAFGFVFDRDSDPVASLGLVQDLPNGIVRLDFDLETDPDEGDRTTILIGREMELPAGSLIAEIGATRADVGGTDLIGALAWTAERPDGEMSVRLERSVSFDDGDLEVVADTSLTFNYSQTVNDRSSILFNLSHAISDAPSERIERSEFGATYSYELTEDWNLDSGASYRVRDGADGRSESPQIFLSLNRAFESLR